MTAVHPTPEWERMLASMAAFFRSVPPRSGGYVLEPEGVVAGVSPAIPERSLPNSVVYEREEALADAYAEIAAAHDEAGTAWTVWVPAHHDRARALLERNGHVLDASPAAMIADLAGVAPPAADDPEPDPAPRWEDVGRLNDEAYGTGDSFARMTGSGDADPESIYVARADGRPVAAAGTQDLAGDCSAWYVATSPEARGRGLASGLMRRALSAGLERGCDVSTLQATRMGAPVYERLGYRTIGTLEMWERRPV